MTEISSTAIDASVASGASGAISGIAYYQSQATVNAQPASALPTIRDSVTLSAEGLTLAAEQRISPNGESSASTDNLQEQEQSATDTDSTATAEGEENRQDTATTSLTDTELREVKELAQTDREVRAHEQAHKNVAGAYAGPISYTYEKGPNGQRYAVAGEVPIDLSEEDTPEETVQKMQVVRRAALAPADPSGADRQVAAEAAAKAAQAQSEALAEETKEKQQDADTVANDTTFPPTEFPQADS